MAGGSTPCLLEVWPQDDLVCLVPPTCLALHLTLDLHGQVDADDSTKVGKQMEIGGGPSSLRSRCGIGTLDQSLQASPGVPPFWL